MMETRNEVGATLFGAYYFKALDWTIATNDDALIRALAAPSCRACQRVIAATKRLHSKGEREVGGRIQVRAAVIDDTKYKLEYDYAVRVTYDEQAVQVVSGNKVTRTATPAARDTGAIVFVSWRGRGWSVVEVTAT